MSTSSEEEFISKKRKNRRFWEEDEDDDERYVTGETRRANKFGDLSRPVNFVKSSTEEEQGQTGSDDEKTTVNNEKEATQQEEKKKLDEEEEEEESDGSEVGFIRRRQGKIPSGSLPRNFGVVRKVKNDYLFASTNKVDGNRKQADHESSVTSQGNQLGSWEKYTKGFGSKMLQKMGFAGRLGAYEQGLSKPLEPQVRPKYLGLAAEGFREKPNVFNNISTSSNEKKSVSSVEETQRQSTAGTKRWRRKRDVVETKETRQTPDVVIDMRGPESRLLNNVAESLQQETLGTQSKVFLPELQYNIRILKDLTKASLEQSSEQIKVEQKRMRSLRSELNTLKDRQSALEETKSRLKSFLELVKEMNASISLHELISIIRRAVERYSENLEESGILDALTACAQRHLNAYFGKEEYYWTPTKIPEPEWIQDIAYLGNILGGRDESKMYSQLLYHTIIVRIKRHLASSNFDAQQPHDLVYFLEKCYQILPEAMIENLAADIIYPRLVKEVERDSWQVSENLMPHHWIFPWLPLLGKHRVAHLFEYIWRRIGKSIMTNWHPSESFARDMIEPWLQIARKTSLSKLFHRYVIPRLEQTLKEELVIEIPNKDSVSSQGFSVFYWIMSWYGILENEALAGILLKGFFPIWLETLLRWLRLQDVDWEQVTIWYDFWKQKFPAEIQKMNKIRRAFDIALDVMNRSMMGEDTENMDIHRRLLFLSQVPKKVEEEEEAVTATIPLSSTAYDKTSFKDLVGFFAERNGVTLIPCHHTYGFKQPMYLFGNIPIRLDHQQQVVYYQSSSKTEWKPVALEDLLQMIKGTEQKHGASHRVA
ncbi:hypothetical protein GAYE_SCF28MG4752 [Galdieria yellowstonensis]|uniref:G-patch domain-containing protein n=1 Tax=Galdieria yellowstonensis TaxID=3028027 RepID=A0AAV9IHQ3_9RHOD|nr:hypothetical protein GAYE_SCF28MG4752 [Galdieria yellowstonensis]